MKTKFISKVIKKSIAKGRLKCKTEVLTVVCFCLMKACVQNIASNISLLLILEF